MTTGGFLLQPEFIRLYQKFEKALEEVGGADLGAHVNVKGRNAFCFTKGPDSDAIRRAHEKLNFPFDSITEVRRVTGRPAARTRLMIRQRQGATVFSTGNMRGSSCRSVAYETGILFLKLSCPEEQL